MKILAISDNHGDKDVIEYVLNSVKDIDIYLHAGDSQLNEYELRPFVSVKGNNDYLINKTYRVITTSIGKIYLTHGHLERNYQSMIYKARSLNCNIIIHGHTHRSKFTKYDDMIVICPGALKHPHGGEYRRYAIINIDDVSKELDVKFVDIK